MKKHRHFFTAIISSFSCTFIVLWLFFIVTGCAGAKGNVAASDSNEMLKNTATHYWKLRMEDKYEETYKIEDKEGLPSFKDYVLTVSAMKKFNIIKHTVRDVHTEGNRGKISLELSFIMPPVSKPFKKTLDDDWILRDGEWKHLLSPSP